MVTATQNSTDKKSENNPAITSRNKTVDRVGYGAFAFVFALFAIIINQNNSANTLKNSLTATKTEIAKKIQSTLNANGMAACNQDSLLNVSAPYKATAPWLRKSFFGPPEKYKGNLASVAYTVISTVTVGQKLQNTADNLVVTVGDRDDPKVHPDGFTIEVSRDCVTKLRNDALETLKR